MLTFQPIAEALNAFIDDETMTRFELDAQDNTQDNEQDEEISATNYTDERFEYQVYEFEDLPDDLQDIVAESLAERFDYDGYYWHTVYAKEEIHDIENNILAAQGFVNPKIHSTESFCVQGDSSCFSAEGIYVDAFWERYGDRFENIPHAKWLISKFFHVTIKNNETFSSRAIVEPSNYYYYLEDLSYNHSIDRLIRVRNQIKDQLDDIIQDLNWFIYDKLKEAFDYWYSAENVKEYCLANERSVFYNGSYWEFRR